MLELGLSLVALGAMIFGWAIGLATAPGSDEFRPTVYAGPARDSRRWVKVQSRNGRTWLVEVQ